MSEDVIDPCHWNPDSRVDEITIGKSLVIGGGDGLSRDPVNALGSRRLHGRAPIRNAYAREGIVSLQVNFCDSRAWN